MARFELASHGSDRWSQQICNRVVELGQVHANPGPEEDYVAHQGLVLEGCAE